MRGHYQYDSREVLGRREAHQRERHIGVLVSEPFHHWGMNATYVDVGRDTISVTSVTGGGCHPAGEVQEQARSATEATIADLDRVIEELVGHRDRLLSELKVIDEREWDIELRGEG